METLEDFMRDTSFPAIRHKAKRAKWLRGIELMAEDATPLAKAD